MCATTVEFKNCPLEDVVFDIHFDSITDFKFTDLGKIANLYTGDFPKIREMPPIPSQIEPFDAPPQVQQFQVQVGQSPQTPRLWLLAEDEASLVQFQSDRFIFNWRCQNQQNAYPSFEELFRQYKDLVCKLSESIKQHFRCELRVRQIELRYINQISHGELARLEDVFTFLETPFQKLEGFEASFGELIVDEMGHPNGRLVCELRSGFVETDDHWLSLTVRARPTSLDMADVFEAFNRAHRKIVESFVSLTTEKAHKIWEKVDG